MKFTMIDPILPVPIPDADSAWTIVAYAVYFALTAMTAFLVSQYAAGHFKGSKKKTALAFVGISICIAALLLYFFGCSVGAVQGILFCLLLLYASYSDIKTRQSDDCLALMIALTAFIGREVTDIPAMLLSAVLLTLPMLVVLLTRKGTAVGGADIKLTAACGFLLGIRRGLVGLIAGLLLGVGANLITQSKKERRAGFPLIPYLAAGFMAAYFL